MIVQAGAKPHAEELAVPRVESRSPTDDEYRVTLLLPQGQGLEWKASERGLTLDLIWFKG